MKSKLFLKSQKWINLGIIQISLNNKSLLINTLTSLKLQPNKNPIKNKFKNKLLKSKIEIVIKNIDSYIFDNTYVYDYSESIIVFQLQSYIFSISFCLNHKDILINTLNLLYGESGNNIDNSIIDCSIIDTVNRNNNDNIDNNDNRDNNIIDTVDNDIIDDGDNNDNIDNIDNSIIDTVNNDIIHTVNDNIYNSKIFINDTENKINKYILLSKLNKNQYIKYLYNHNIKLLIDFNILMECGRLFRNNEEMMIYFIEIIKRLERDEYFYEKLKILFFDNLEDSKFIKFRIELYNRFVFSIFYFDLLIFLIKNDEYKIREFILEFDIIKLILEYMNCKMDNKFLIDNILGNKSIINNNVDSLLIDNNIDNRTIIDNIEKDDEFKLHFEYKYLIFIYELLNSKHDDFLNYLFLDESVINYLKSFKKINDKRINYLNNIINRI